LTRYLAIALTMLALDAAPAAADCLPAADLSGDADVAAEVARALSSLGVVHGEIEGACEPVAATVLRDEGGVAVTVRDARGRIEGRVVADAYTAAAWIESWASDDAEALWSATMTAPEKERDEVAVAAVEIAPPSEAEIVIADEAPSRTRWVPAIAVRAGRDVASDGSAWDGLGVAGCVRVGRYCVGAMGKYAANGSFTDTGGLTRFDRSATVVAATAALRVRVAKVEIAPEIVAGVGWTATRRDEPDEPCVNADGTVCTGEPLYVGDGAETTTVAARVGAGVGFAVPLARWLWLDGRVGAEAAPGARTEPWHPVVNNGDPGCDPTTDPNGCNDLPVPADDPLLDLPGEPAWSWGGAIGLRVELP
jgi:hypothetical protein